MQKLLNYKITAVILALAVGWMGFWAVMTHLQRREVDRRIGTLEREIGEAERTNEQLKQFQEYSGNPSYLERQARIRLNYQDPGEQVVFIYASSSEPSAPPSKKETAFNNMQKWWAYLLGR